MATETVNVDATAIRALITAEENARIAGDAASVATAAADATSKANAAQAAAEANALADATAKANAAQAFAIQRANHTGTQLAASISDFNSAAIAAAPAETVNSMGALTNGATAKATPVDADIVPLGDSASSFSWKKVTWANIKATLKTYFDGLYSPLRDPVFLNYTGGSQANSTDVYQDVHSSAVFTGLVPGVYELNLTIIHNTAGINNGPSFSINGPAFNFLSTVVLYDVSNTQESIVQVAYNWNTPSSSCRSTTNNRVLLTSRVRLTASGDIALRFKSENAGQVITVTDVTGYIRRIG